MYKKKTKLKLFIHVGDASYYYALFRAQSRVLIFVKFSYAWRLRQSPGVRFALPPSTASFIITGYFFTRYVVTNGNAAVNVVDSSERGCTHHTHAVYD